VPVEQGREINIPEGQNENVDQDTAPQLEGAIDLEDEMLLDGTLRPCVHRTAPPVGPTLVMLGNAGRNAVRRPPRHYTVVQNNRSTHGRTGQSNIPRPYSANNGTLKKQRVWHALKKQRVALVGIIEQVSQIGHFYLSWIRTP
jgi:hypothetical protein